VVSGRRCTQHATKEPTHTNTIRSACVSYKTNNSSHPGLIQGTQELSDARVHYPDLKQQPHTTPTPTRGAADGRVQTALQIPLQIALLKPQALPHGTV